MLFFDCHTRPESDKAVILTFLTAAGRAASMVGGPSCHIHPATPDMQKAAQQERVGLFLAHSSCSKTNGRHLLSSSIQISSPCKPLLSSWPVVSHLRKNSISLANRSLFLPLSIFLDWQRILHIDPAGAQWLILNLKVPLFTLPCNSLGDLGPVAHCWLATKGSWHTL